MSEPTAEFLLHQFCAKLQDEIYDRRGVRHDVTWEVDRAQPGIVNIHVGRVESYSIYVNTQEWIVYYK